MWDARGWWIGLGAMAVACSSPPPAPPPSAEALPPGHPSMGNLPPGHPPMGNLPPGHPATGSMPPGHPATSDDAPAGHPAVNRAAAADPKLAEALAEVDRQFSSNPASFEAAAARSETYYKHHRYADALDSAELAVTRAKEAIDLLVAKPAPAKAKGCEGDASIASLLARAKAAQAKKDAATAAACLDRMRAPIAAVLAREANVHFVQGEPAEAVAGHEQAIAVSPKALDSHFYVGAILLDTQGGDAQALARADEAFRKFLELAPKDDPRRPGAEDALDEIARAMRGTGGSGKELPAGHPPIGPTGPAPAGPGFLDAALRAPGAKPADGADPHLLKEVLGKEAAAKE